MLHRWDGIGQVMSSGWCLPDMTLRIEVKQFILGFIRPEYLVFHSPLGAFLQAPSGLSCVFHRGQASVWPLCHKAQIGGVLQ